MGKFFRGLRNKIQASLKKKGGERGKHIGRMMVTHSERANRIARLAKKRKGFRAVVNFLKIKF